MKMKWYDKKHPMKSGIMLASGVALVMAGTWMGMRVMRHRSRYMEEESSC